MNDSQIIGFVRTDSGSAQIVQDGEDEFAFETSNGKDTLTRTQLVALAMSVMETLATDDEWQELVDILGH